MARSNAGSRKDLLKMIHAATQALASGTDLVTTDEATAKEHAAKDLQNRMEVLTALTVGGVSAAEKMELASTVGMELAGTIMESVNRIGFVRAICKFQDLVQGQRPEIDVQEKNVTAAVLSGPVQARLQVVRDNVLMPPEVDITARLIIEARHVNTTRRDLLNQKYAEGVEHVLVNEDRSWKAMADKLIAANSMETTHVGSLTSAVLGEGIALISGYNLPVEGALLSSNIYSQLITSKEFENLIEGSARLEIIKTGKIGVMYGMALMTDGTREPRQKVLDAGDIYYVSKPEFVGEYTDRGGVRAEPLTAADTGINGVGWHIVEFFSLGMPNFRAVGKTSIG